MKTRHCIIREHGSVGTRQLLTTRPFPNMERCCWSSSGQTQLLNSTCWRPSHVAWGPLEPHTAPQTPSQENPACRAAQSHIWAGAPSSGSAPEFQLLSGWAHMVPQPWVRGHSGPRVLLSSVSGSGVLPAFQSPPNTRTKSVFV